MTRLTQCMMIAATLLASGTALAQEAAAPMTDRFAQAGQFAIAGERLFGVAHTSQTEKAGGGDQTDSATEVSLLSTGAVANVFMVYNTPRVGFDYFVIDGLSLGGSLGFFSTSTSRSVSGGGNASTSRDGPTYNGVLVAPRIGYAFMFSDVVGIWPRGGITYVGAGSSGPDATSDENGVHLWAVSLEAPLVISPFPHMGFLIAPVADIGFTGSHTRTDGQTKVKTSNDMTATEFGLEAGLFVYF